MVVLHREDQLFDLGRFNQQNALDWRALPAESIRGLSWPMIREFRDIRLDRGVYEAPAIRLYGGENVADVVIAPRDIGAGGTIDCAANLPDAFDKEDDFERIGRAVSKFTGRRLLARLDETLEIPPLPTAAQRILALKSNPDYSLQELVRVVETDPSIAARVMSWACSAFYAANPAPRSLSDAIMRVLGFDLVMNMALGLALAGSLRLPAHEVRGAPPFWTEAVFTAAAMEALARRGDARVRATAGFCYLTGLLANYGTLVVGHVFPPQYQHICLLQEANPQLPVRNIDEHVLSLSREILSARLLEQWGLPESITRTIRHQHDFRYAGDGCREIRLLQTARALLGYGADPLGVLEEDRLMEMGLRSDDLDAVGTLLVDSRDALDGLARAVA
jgi:HD-like signal output (HDOD) protein